MSLSRLQTRAFNGGFPRVSGDEPDQAITAVSQLLFSPRERG